MQKACAFLEKCELTVKCSNILKDLQIYHFQWTGIPTFFCINISYQKDETFKRKKVLSILILYRIILTGLGMPVSKYL